MPSRLLQSEASALIIVDVQERLMPAIADGEALLRRLEILAQAAARLGVPVLATEHYPAGLGRTLASLGAFVPEAERFEKISFAALQEPAFRARLESLGRSQLVVAGSEAHVCVLQTALSLAEAGYQTFIVTDATGSRDPADAQAALARMARAGIESVTTEMVVFEWLARADRPEFKQLLALIK